MEKLLRWALPLACAALVFWVRLLPLSLPGTGMWATRVAREHVRSRIAEATPADAASPNLAAVEARVSEWIAGHQAEFDTERRDLESQRRAELQYDGSDGHPHVYLGDVDSYHWLRMARNYLRAGTTCDAVVDGECRNTFVNAPVGARMMYGRSLHIVAIVALHRLITFLIPAYPLPASSFWVPVLIGVLGVFPAFGIGRRLAGTVGGVCAAVLTGLDTTLLARSLGSDDDVWSVVLPLFMMWAAIAALQSARRRRQAAYTLLAAGCAGLHAGTWSGWIFAYTVLLAGLSANLALQGVRLLVEKSRNATTAAAQMRGAVFVSVLFYVAAGVFVSVANPAVQYLALPGKVAEAILGTPARAIAPAAVPDPDGDLWPDVLHAVGELAKPGLGGIMRALGGDLYVCAGIAGLLFLLLPRGRWRLSHVLVFTSGICLAAAIVGYPGLGRFALFEFLGVPMIVAVVLGARGADESGGAELVVAIWFLASWYAAFNALRLVLLVGPPFALALATLIGRAYESLRPAAGTRHTWAVHIALASAVTLILVPPIRAGIETARNYTPQVNDAWWETLAGIRVRTSPDAIINAWADHGYWIEYGAERRVTADGSSFLTHIHHWFAKALATASERESVGLLRMLNCGSDATPQPEGGRGAFQKVRARVHDSIAAHDIVLTLATRGVAEARAYLAQHGFSAADQDNVLQSTHCEPPESYLVLSTDQFANAPLWMHLALWDFRRAYVAARARQETENQAVTDLVQHAGYSEPEARAAYREVRALSIDDLDNFVAPHPSALSFDWHSCRQGADDATLVCPVNRSDLSSGDLIRDFVFKVGAPSTGRLRVSPAGTKDSDEVSPAAILLAGPHSEEEISFSSPRYPGLAVLVDVQNRRALFGAPELLRSMFVQLVFLDGRYTTHFEKVAEHATVLGARVLAWRIKWREEPAG